MNVNFTDQWMGKRSPELGLFSWIERKLNETRHISERPL